MIYIIRKIVLFILFYFFESVIGLVWTLSISLSCYLYNFSIRFKVADVLVYTS